MSKDLHFIIRDQDLEIESRSREYDDYLIKLESLGWCKRGKHRNGK